MTVNDGWARASLRLVSISDTEVEVPQGLAALARRGRDPKVVLLPVADEEILSLQEVLGRLAVFLEENRNDLHLVGAANTARLEVFLGWSPRAPQESVSLGPTLVRALADLDAGLVIDTYSE